MQHPEPHPRDLRQEYNLLLNENAELIVSMNRLKIEMQKLMKMMGNRHAEKTCR